jgi:hypothetical protein
MTDYGSPDYCAHGIGIDLLCEDCDRWYRSKMHFQNDDVPTLPYTCDDEGDINDFVAPEAEKSRQIAPSDILNVRNCLDWAEGAWREWRGTSGTVSHTLTTKERSMINAKQGEEFVRFATGGQRENEDIIAVVQKNPRIKDAWCLSTRDGLHIYRY